jgi:hypothetical protein
MDLISIVLVRKTPVGEVPCQGLIVTSDPLNGMDGHSYQLTNRLPIRDLKEIVSKKLGLVCEFFLFDPNQRQLQVGWTLRDYGYGSGELRIFIERTGSDRAHF